MLKRQHLTRISCLVLSLTMVHSAFAAKACSLYTSFTPTARYTYNCNSGEYVISNDLINQYCNIKGNTETGIKNQVFTVNRDMYSIFCKNGASVLVNCTYGNFSKAVAIKRGNSTVYKLTCLNNY